ncbi:AAA family ATPase [Brevundimonas sp.]|uniref:RAD55 family ATPase n=1 Tax=Brevundimonas sp. TaxID=1871086 RepID=UPI002730DCAE|nr:AAA family ATPase [Brevundimonas sp.]MDP1912112.1 AAA family ATPase [Brevundimonas sp.]
MKSAKRFEYYRVSVPSPLWIAKQILTDPDYPASEAYAIVALRAYLFEKIEHSFGISSLDLSVDSISGAYETFANRRSVSRDLLLGGSPQTMLISHFLAMRGLMHLQMRYNPAHPDFSDRFEELFGDLNRHDSPLFARRQRGVSVRADPEIEELPTTADLVTELTGLPIPIEGMNTLFRGGLRLAQGGDLVAAVSGTFGAGKTSFCLGLAASLAPLGCKTLFLSCEEPKIDLDARLREAIPANLTRTTPLLSDVRLTADVGSAINDTGDEKAVQERFPWFYAAKIDAPDYYSEEGRETDVAASLIELLRPILEPRDPDDASDRTRDPTRRLRLIIIDGIHQLFRGTSGGQEMVDHALSKIVEFCRAHQAIFIFTVGQGEREDRRLEYVCDLVISLDRVGFESSEQQPTRIMKLLKARRQAVRPGAHLFHLTAPRGLRVKPSLSAISDEAKARSWINPDSDQILYLSTPMIGSRSSIIAQARRRSLDRRLVLGFRRYSQILVKGRGSSGKSALGLSLLHRRPLPPLEARRLARAHFLAQLGFERRVAWTESRVLIVSFLYPEQHYASDLQRLHIAGRADDASGSDTEGLEGGFELTPEPNLVLANRSAHGPYSPRALLPDSFKQDVLSLYPGHLMPEDLLGKIARRLQTAALRGLPYTGVLIDGIHNVFLQFPEIERAPGLWPQLYNLLRRKGVSVVITHTDFEVHGGEDKYSQRGEYGGVDNGSLDRKSAPILSSLVSAGDYVFDIAPIPSTTGVDEQQRTFSVRYRALLKEALEEEVRGTVLLWDRARCRWFRGSEPLDELIQLGSS